ncbi:MAG: lipoxygenase family protein [Polyangiales bacterium]
MRLEQSLAGVGAGSAGASRSTTPWALVEGHDEVLRPVAIQLDPQPDPRRPIYTPADGAWWEFATLAAQCADLNLQALEVHLGRAHLLQEALLLATARCLPERHPLRALLRPSMQFTFAINRSVRDDLMVPGTDLESILAPTLGQPGARARRGVGVRPRRVGPARERRRSGPRGPRAVPVARRDAMDLWRATRDFVAAWLALYYADDAAVAADAEVTAWAAEMASPWGGRLRVVVPRTRRRITDPRSPSSTWQAPGHNVANYARSTTPTRALRSPPPPSSRRCPT